VSKLAVYLRLGRVSNLPTVWTNVLAGAALARVPLSPAAIAVALLACSLLYTAGMFLNDAFDHRHDAAHQPERPIARGLVGAGEVYAVGFVLLGGGALLLLPFGRAFAAALALAATIVVYDAWHKRNPLSPLLMALCRALVYVTAAYATGARALGWPLYAGCALLFAYLVGLTWWAKRGGSGIARLIAGISLVDGALMLLAGAPWLALLGPAGFVATLRLQRRVRGT
jgi:4-hydroxybenzoate polyprenyltransferase